MRCGRSSPKAEKKAQCGWLKDKYGLSWQIVPTVLGEMLQDKDAEKTERVMKAILQMKKLDIKTLKQAYEQHIITWAKADQSLLQYKEETMRITHVTLIGPVLF